MSKEMFISSSPHETRVAVCEDDQFVELFIERDTDVGLVGGIYKGRVNRVLPGMQSAFVNIGLERDAFLYVSDFFMQGEEFEGLFDDERSRVVAIEDSPPAVEASSQPSTDEAAVSSAPPEQGPAEGESAPAAGEPAPSAVVESSPLQEPSVKAEQQPSSQQGEDRGFSRHGRRGRRRRHGSGRFNKDRNFPPRREPQARPAEPASSSSGFEVLPGESLAKYRHAGSEPEQAEASDAGEAPPVHQEREVAVEANETTAREVPKAEVPEHSEFSLRSNAPQAEVTSPSEDEPTQEIPAAESDSVSSAPGDDQPDTPESTATAAGEEAGEAAPEEEDGFPEGVSQETLETAAPAGSGEANPEEAATPGTESGDRQYTLREQHTRPRFAPRRRHRGRRGMRHGRRFDKPRDAAKSSNNQPLKISELLKEGQEILVQIAKEPLGTKGARITSHIALPGRYLVYMPTISHIGVSRRIPSEQERLRLRNVILEHRGALTGGFIVRTAAEGRSEEELKNDLKFLTTLWTDIRAKSERSKAPALIYRDLDLVQRILRDTLTPDFKAIRADNEMDYERVVEFISRAQPALLPNVRLHTRETPLFEESGIQAELEKALRPKVWLKSGGYIVINQTEALVAIDVNTGKYVGKTNRLEDTILKTNIDAVKEIVRQLRLRDLGGIIVIDFIDMDERRNRNRVVQALEEALRHDRAPTKVLAFNEFGLVALTRKRVKQSLQRSLCEPCEFCNGSGWIKSVTTVCNEILSEARKLAQQIDGKTITLRVNPVVARELKSKEGLLISEIESSVRKEIVIKSDPTVHQERFEIF